MGFKTNKEKEQHLNATYSEIYTQENAIDNFIYLTSRQRSKRTTESHIIKCYSNGTLGSLLRRLDPIAFNCA